MTPPSLTVLVFCRNYASYVVDCLQSVFATDQPCELVFADNGSKDDSLAVARQTLAAAPAHITTKVVALSPERPLCPALNAAMAECTGEIIKLISADDMLGPNFFSTLRSLVATSTSDIGVWLAGSVTIDAAGAVLRQSYSPALFGAPADGRAIDLDERHIVDGHRAPVFTAPSIFYRRKVYEAIGGYDERFRYEDKPFLFDVLARGWRAVVYPFNNTYYRVHGNGISANPAWMAEARLPVMFDHALRARWRNKPIALYHLARNARVVAMNRWRARREER